jgi:hypothetical protein
MYPYYYRNHFVDVCYICSSKSDEQLEKIKRNKLGQKNMRISSSTNNAQNSRLSYSSIIIYHVKIKKDNPIDLNLNLIKKSKAFADFLKKEKIDETKLTIINFYNTEQAFHLEFQIKAVDRIK